jgi:elongation factor Ts
MSISVEAIKELRNLSSASFSQCKSALEEASGNVQKAIEVLRRKGLESAAKKSDRASKEGRVDTYVHMGNKIGVMVEVSCETDFVARNSDFTQFTKDLAMQIAAASPLYIRREDVPAEVLNTEKDKEYFCKNYCLLEQAYIKDPSMTIKDYLGGLITKIGESIQIRRFIRYKLGE